MANFELAGQRFTLARKRGIDFDSSAEKRIRNRELAGIVLRLLETELRRARDAPGLVARDRRTGTRGYVCARIAAALKNYENITIMGRAPG